MCTFIYTIGRRGVKLNCGFDQLLQIDLAGTKLKISNIRKLTKRDATLFHSGDDPFTPGGFGVFFGKPSFPNEARRKETVRRDLGRCAPQQLVTEVIK